MDVPFYRFSLEIIRYFVDVDRSFVGKIVEHVVSGQGGGPALFVAEYQVDPMVKVVGYVF